jgi:hypothetical protein
MFTIDSFGCHSWKMVSEVGLDVLFHNLQDSDGIREKAGNINNNTEVLVCLATGHSPFQTEFLCFWRETVQEKL